MTDPRIPTHLWLEAKIRELSTQGIGVYVIHKGEKMDGLVLLKLNDMKGSCKLLTRQRDIDGVLAWVNVFSDDVIEERKADDYISRAISRDPDLWVVEAETLDNVLLT
jgi:hypothetical protein